MNRIQALIITLAMLLATLGANAAPPAYALQVDGLACPFCAYGIEKKLSSIKGVAKIDIDIKKGQAIVTMSEGASLSEQVAREKVKDAGFTLGSFVQVGR